MGLFDKLFMRKPTVSRQDAVTQSNAKSQSITTLQQIKRGCVSVCKAQIDERMISGLQKRYIAFDVETTGFSPTDDRIIEVGAVLFDGGEIAGEYNTLVNPNVKIPPAASAVNHITNDMLASAPPEREVYSTLVQFLGDSLNEQTLICAHNATFDVGFLSETLIRWGYDAKICYVDTLSLSRNMVKGLVNYKQDTVAAHFGIKNERAHRAASDAAVCGKILWGLLPSIALEEKQRSLHLQKSKPSDEEMEVCAYIQDSIVRHGGSVDCLGFVKNSSNYVNISYLYSILKFKSGQKGKYIIVEKSALVAKNFVMEPCTISEGGTAYVRVYFDSPFELEPLAAHFFNLYEKSRQMAQDYFEYNNKYEEIKNTPAILNALSSEEIEALLVAAEKRRDLKQSTNVAVERKAGNNPTSIDRTDIIINPINNRVPLSDILNSDNWEKGFDDGYQFWEKGENFRKEWGN